MKVYLLHAIGVDGVQITENQRDNLLSVMSKSPGSDKMIEINGYAIKISAIMTIEPVEEQPKEYLIMAYNNEADSGLHERYKKRLTYQEALSINQGRMVEEALRAKPDKEKVKIWDSAPKRSQFVNMHDYIKARSKFMKENFTRKDKNGKF